MIIIRDIEIIHWMYGDGNESWEIFIDNVSDSTYETVSRVFEALERIGNISNFTFKEYWAD